MRGQSLSPFLFLRLPVTHDVSLKQRINDDLKAAMRGGDSSRRDAVRLILAALKQREVDERKELADADVVAVIDKMIKQRREAIAQFEKGGRQDLAEKEQFELGVLQTYMPASLSEAEIEAAVAEAITAAGAKAPSDMGKVMGVLKGKLSGRADMSKVSALVKSRLAG